MYNQLYYEVRLMGKKGFFPQVLVVIVATLFATLLAHNNGPTARFLSAVLEMLLPLATGASVALLTAYDPALELQLTWRRKYAITVSLRIATLTLWNSSLAFVVSSIIYALGLEFLPKPQHASTLFIFLVSQLTWLPSLLACIAFGFGTALLLQSRAASVSLLAVLWLMEIVFKNIMIQTIWFFPLILFPTTLFPDGLTFSDWLLNRLLVLCVAMTLLLISWPLLLLPERLLKGSHQE